MDYLEQRYNAIYSPNDAVMDCIVDLDDAIPSYFLTLIPGYRTELRPDNKRDIVSEEDGDVVGGMGEYPHWFPNLEMCEKFLSKQPLLK